MSDRRDPDVHRLVMDWPDDAVAEIERLRAEVRRLRDWQQEMIDAVNSGKVYRIRALIEEAGRE